jgi:hypothetical protein
VKIEISGLFYRVIEGSSGSRLDESMHSNHNPSH